MSKLLSAVKLNEMPPRIKYSYFTFPSPIYGFDPQVKNIFLLNTLLSFWISTRRKTTIIYTLSEDIKKYK